MAYVINSNCGLRFEKYEQLPKKQLENNEWRVKRMMKKIIALVMVMLLVLASVGVQAEASVGEWWNILLLGCDDRDEQAHTGRTDTIMILSVNRELGSAKLTSIMRDTWVKIPGRKNNKINAANVFGGPELVVETVNASFGTDIQNYILINMRDLADIIDLFGGVDLELSESEVKVANDYINEFEFGFYNKKSEYPDYSRIASAGMVHLNGSQAMAHCRDRYTDSDFGRVMRGQDTLLALAKKAQSMEVDACLDIAGEIRDFVVTNLTDEQARELAKAILTMEVEEVGQHRLPAEGAYKSGTFDGIWMIKADLEKNAQILKSYIYG